jgi:hypothetical protein
MNESDVSKGDQLLLSICNSNPIEKIRRLTTTITPVQNIYPVVESKSLIDRALNNTKGDNAKALTFFDKGILSVLQTEQEILDVVHALGLFKYQRDQSYIADMFTGLSTMLTRGEKFLDTKLTYMRGEDGKEYLKSITLYTTVSTLYKAALGPLVDNSARSLNHTYEITHYAKKIIDPIIYGKKLMPRATATLRVTQADGTTKKAWISGEPLHIYRSTKKLSDIVAVELDTDFIPVKIDGGKIIADAQYIHNVAGLTAMLQLGKRLTDKNTDQCQEQPKGISSLTAKRIILTIQMGLEIQRITGLGVKKASNGRYEVIMRRKQIPNIVPEAMRDAGKPSERPNWKAFSNAIAKAGQYFYRAIELTGMLDELGESSIPIYIPATDRGAQFLDKEPYQNVVFLKIDRLER